ITARCSGFDSSRDSVEVEPDNRPLLIAEHYDCDPSIRKILLISYVLVSCQEHVITGLFSLPDQFAVRQFVPTDLPCKGHFVPGKALGYRFRCAIVEEDVHPTAGAAARLSVAKWSTALTSCSVT